VQVVLALQRLSVPDISSKNVLGESLQGPEEGFHIKPPSKEYSIVTVVQSIQRSVPGYMYATETPGPEPTGCTTSITGAQQVGTTSVVPQSSTVPFSNGAPLL